MVGSKALEGMKAKSVREISSEWLDSRSEVSGPPILIADDSDADVFFLLRAFKSSKAKNPVRVVRSGQEALDYLSGSGKFADRERFPMPKIVFLDLKMPAPDGFDVLRWKNAQKLERILWVAMSNFDGVKTINQAYAAGATTFLVKPLDCMDIRNLIDAFVDYWTVSKDTAQPA